MVFAFGHLITAWIAGKVYEFVSKRKLSHLTWLFLLLGGILPDIDHLIDWTLKTQVHRGLSHSILFAVAAAIIVYIIFKSLKHAESKQLAIAIGCGILVHLFMDMLSYPGVPILWPNQLHFSLTSIGYVDASQFTLFNASPEKLSALLKLAVVDMAIGTAWLSYLAIRKRIRF